MKRLEVLSILFAVLLCVGLITGCGGGSDSESSTADTDAAAISLDFTLNNSTGVEIYGVYVSPVEVNQWGEDIMGQDTLADGKSVDITFDPTEETEYWDLMVTDSENNQLTYKNLDLSTISEVTLKLDNGTPTAEVK
ncbi:MAG: hypothetical protein PHN26_04970 [Eubacteriaceae bacterium]|nr:hypothetical protein [Eubacteriaceae bacterium]